jgi:hypothetical protein
MKIVWKSWLGERRSINKQFIEHREVHTRCESTKSSQISCVRACTCTTNYFLIAFRYKNNINRLYLSEFLAFLCSLSLTLTRVCVFLLKINTHRGVFSCLYMKNIFSFFSPRCFFTRWHGKHTHNNTCWEYKFILLLQMSQSWHIQWQYSIFPYKCSTRWHI